MLSQSTGFSITFSAVGSFLILGIYFLTFRSRGFFNDNRLVIISSLSAFFAGLASAVLWITSAHFPDDKYANASAAVFAAATAIFTSTSARLPKWNENNRESADKKRIVFLSGLGAFLAALAIVMLFTGL